MVKMKTIYVDTLDQVWYRSTYKIPEEITPKELVEGIQSGEINSVTGEYLYETATTLYPEKNDKQSTIEVLDENKEKLWQNGKEI